jgi:hypothetical protein
MKKYLALAVVLSMLFFPMISATTSTTTIGLAAKIPNSDTTVPWLLVPDGNCGGLDYTGDHLVNQYDENYVRMNKIDANKDGKYNSTDIMFIRHNYQNCKAGKGLIDFVTVSSGTSSMVQQRVKVSASNLKPLTKYQLIYYGNSSNMVTQNDIGPYATCIGNVKKTSSVGSFNGLLEKFNFLQMQNDGINQKFWVVLASDVDCKEGKMITWNPTEYLFELNTL